MMKNATKKKYIFAWHKDEAYFSLPKSRQITFQSYANLKVLPGGDPEREFAEGSFQLLLFDPQRRNTAGVSSARPGMLLACHP